LLKLDSLAYISAAKSMAYL